jgi:hypothetical protein
MIESLPKRASLTGRREREQRHRRAELHVIRRSEYLMKRVILNFEYQAGAEIEPRPEYRMSEVGPRFLERTDAVEIGHRGMAQTT